jgi:hypothetical protein
MIKESSPEKIKSTPEKMKKKLSPEELKRIEAGVKRAELLAKVLDDMYLDPIIGLWEGEGDAATALAGLYIVYEAQKAGMPTMELVKMIGRTGFDFLAGSIPIVGDIFDFFYKSNKKNAEVLRKHFEEISSGSDMTNELEEDLAQRDRTKEKKDLKGLKGKVEKKNRR